MGLSPQANAVTSDQKGASRFGACLASQKEGDLLLLLDESSSLQQTDPNGQRATAAASLFKTLGKYADRVGANLDFAIAGFAEDYVPEKDWSKLTEASADGSVGELNDLAKKNNGIDTDYWMALDGARKALAARGAGANGGQRCQAIAWFSDGKIDFTERSFSKPYANGATLDTPEGKQATIDAAVESICRSGGLADQLRSGGIVTLGIGLGASSTPADFDVMSAISTGLGLQGKKCGDITDPVPGDFYPVSNIDDMLFAFDSLNPDPGTTSQKGVCKLDVCPEARHNFVLDRSIKSVNILGSGGVSGVVPYLVSPSGEKLELPKATGKTNLTISGVPVVYEWQSESAQTITMQNNGSPQWAGQWAIVYVDTTGQNPDAVSKVNIHITTDIFPALADPKMEWHTGQVVKNVAFGLADEKGNPIPPADLAGSATLTVTLVPDGAQPIPIIDQVDKDAIASPVDVDLTKVDPGRASLKMSLVVTTAPALDPQGGLIAAGTELSLQELDVPVQLLPKVGLPTVGTDIDFGSDIEAKSGKTATLQVNGPGCAWVSDAPKVVASPDGVGNTQVTSSTNSPDTCLKVQKGETGQLTVELRTDEDGNGGLNGTVPVHVAALDDPSDSQVVQVPFKASLIKPLDQLSFVLVLIAALILGPGIPLALLYASKWWASKIPSTPLLAERISVQVDSDRVLRNGEPFTMADQDLVQPVQGLAEATRKLRVHGVLLSTVLGRSPFGLGRVVVDAGTLVSVSSELPGTDKSGLHATLPLAVHNKWVVLHDPAGPASHADVLLLVAGSTDVAARERIYTDVDRRLPGLLNGLRLRATQAGIASPYDDGAQASPFGATMAGQSVGYDPFGDGAAGAPFGGGPGPAPGAPTQYGRGPSAAPPYGGSPGAATPYGGSPSSAPPPPRRDPDPFDPFG